ncbi:MAG: hypothetical protein GEU99_13705 [Luteitalea sp.]|nr:hypothetical protein [Luteitalea sp.]
MRIWTVSLGVALLCIVLSACDGDDSPTAPDPPGGGQSGATITITSDGVSPEEVTIEVGQMVTFRNNDNTGHEMRSNPHPTHGQCPPINQVGELGAGQTKQTGVFNSAMTCGFHDHDDASNESLHGTITIR